MTALIFCVIVLPAIEGGSWLLTKAQLDADAALAAVASADAVQGHPLNGQTARAAYQVASQELAGLGGGEIDPDSLRVLDGGKVRFTAHRRASSLLLGHLAWTRDLMVVSVGAEGRSVDAGDLPLVPDHVIDNLPRSAP